MTSTSETWKRCLRRAIDTHYSGESGECVFDLFMREFDYYYDSLGCNDMKGLKQVKGKNRDKGIQFELMCVEMMRLGLILPRMKFVEVHRFDDLTPELKRNLSLVKSDGRVLLMDVGIDIVARSDDGKWSAIQCKYRKRPRPGAVQYRGHNAWKLSRTELSTFLSLVSLTGPTDGWHRHIVVTNALGVVWDGLKRNERDLVIANGTMVGMSLPHWLTLCGYTAHTLSGNAPATTQPAPTPSSAPKTLTPSGLAPRKRSTLPRPSTLRTHRESFLSTLDATKH